MPIQKRLTDEQRLSKTVGGDLRAALRHPYLVGMQTYGGYDASPKALTKAISRVGGWKGANWRDKCFVYVLVNVLYRATGESFLTNSNYERLKKHIWNNDQDILSSAGLQFHSPSIWDVQRLKHVRPGTLPLPPPKSLKRLKATHKRRSRTKPTPTPAPSGPPKRRKLSKHR